LKNRQNSITDIFTSSAEETRRVGENIAGKLRKGGVVTLTGGLGSGKTTFVQGMFRKLGIKGFARSSSFIIANEYRSKRNKLYHIDLYRLNSKDINALGLEEYLKGDGITVIEWADKLKKNFLKSSLNVNLKLINEKERRIRVTFADENPCNRNFRPGF
jgi:tRNA threonylcarbamoyladenosine biosynthesis protein TsaE